MPCLARALASSAVPSAVAVASPPSAHATDRTDRISKSAGRAPRPKLESNARRTRSVRLVSGSLSISIRSDLNENALPTTRSRRLAGDDDDDADDAVPQVFCVYAEAPYICLLPNYR